MRGQSLACTGHHPQVERPPPPLPLLLKWTWPNTAVTRRSLVAMTVNYSDVASGLTTLAFRRMHAS